VSFVPLVGVMEGAAAPSYQTNVPLCYAPVAARLISRFTLRSAHPKPHPETAALRLRIVMS